MGEGKGRFAPSITGYAHPGTVLNALLSWLFARSTGRAYQLRFEDLDRSRFRQEYSDSMRAMLTWLGLDWDEEIEQSKRLSHYEYKMDQLAAQRRLYACSCSRSQLKKRCEKFSDGSVIYDGYCQKDKLDENWRDSTLSIRCYLGNRPTENSDNDFWSDPVLRRQNGEFTYHLAVLVDDGETGVDQIVRGKDLFSLTRSQRALGELCGYASMEYFHHALLLESQDTKLAKLHQSFPFEQWKSTVSPEAVCGQLARMVGLTKNQEISIQELLSEFSVAGLQDENVHFTGWLAAQDFNS